jgi:hypothetical protein
VESVRRYLFDELTPDQVDALGAIARAVTDRLGAGCAAIADVCADTADPCD